MSGNNENNKGGGWLFGPYLVFCWDYFFREAAAVSAMPPPVTLTIRDRCSGYGEGHPDHERLESPSLQRHGFWS